MIAGAACSTSVGLLVLELAVRGYRSATGQPYSEERTRQEILGALDHPQFTTELALFNKDVPGYDPLTVFLYYKRWVTPFVFFFVIAVSLRLAASARSVRP